MTQRRTFMRVLSGSVAGALMVLAAPQVALAQAGNNAWPQQPLRFIVPFPPGGPTDSFVRAVSGPLGEKLGQTVVVENRAGAGGAIGIDAVAKAAPDGYTMGLGSGGALVALPHLTQVPYSVTDDLAYVSGLARVSTVLAVTEASGIKTLDQLLEAVRAKPGKMNYTSPGTGTLTHLVGELFTQETKADIVHIPYKGAAPAITDLLGGQVEMSFADLTPILPHVQAGTVRALVITSPERTPLLPDVPTMTELGYPAVVHTTEYGVIMPAGTPPEIVSRVQEALAEVLSSDSVREAYARMGADPAPSKPEEYRKMVLDTYKYWGDFIKERNISMN